MIFQNNLMIIYIELVEQVELKEKVEHLVLSHIKRMIQELQ